AHEKLVDVLRISADGQTLISGGSDGSLLICRWQADQGGWMTAASHVLPGEIDGIAISPDQKWFVTTSKAASLDFWSLPDGKLLRDITLPCTAWRLAVQSDGRRCALGTWDRTIQLWDTSSLLADPNKVQQTMELVGHTQLVTGQAF